MIQLARQQMGFLLLPGLLRIASGGLVIAKQHAGIGENHQPRAVGGQHQMTLVAIAQLEQRDCVALDLQLPELAQLAVIEGNLSQLFEDPSH